ncbi:MAG: hypothetical protein MUF05_04930 [Candidatus Omnitrophica bacterium]|jgi:hypothetical protein|nr:hypothetical protein [Candidatus Omnitrophota bacterium]
MKQKKWAKPKLTVLVRGCNNEKVLFVCKVGGAGPDIGQCGCETNASGCPKCSLNIGS